MIELESSNSKNHDELMDTTGVVSKSAVFIGHVVSVKVAGCYFSVSFEKSLSLELF